MATPGIQNGCVTVVAAATVMAPVDQNGHSAAALRLSSPIRIFLFFHKAIRTELDGLHRTALALATNRSGGSIKQLMEKCHFLRSIYRHHCNAEDEVRIRDDHCCRNNMKEVYVLTVTRFHTFPVVPNRESGVFEYYVGWELLMYYHFHPFGI